MATHGRGSKYIEGEMGHEEWILDDIAACGGDREAARNATPLPATELMVAYAYDMIQRRNPLGFFGMVLVLEGISVAIASRVAAAIRLPPGRARGTPSVISIHTAFWIRPTSGSSRTR